MKSILVTGAQGFVGRALTETLIKNNYSVHAATRGPKPSLSAIHWHTIDDIHQTTDWSSALSGVDTVIHLAARVHVMKETAAKPLSLFRKVNTIGTERLLQQAAASGVRRFIYLSTSKVSGENTTQHPYTESQKSDPQDAYAISKWEAECIVRTLATQLGMEWVIVRPPLIYGPHVKGNFERLLKWVAQGLPLPLGAIDNRRSLVGLDNLNDFLMLCIEHTSAAGQTFFVSDGEDLSTPALVRRLAVALQKPARVFSVPPYLLEQAAKLLGKKNFYDRLCGSLQLDISKARTLLNWQPPVSVSVGLGQVVDSFTLSGRQNDE